MIDLRDFAELNYTAFFKAAKKHDKVTGERLLDAAMRCVDAQPFTAALNPMTALTTPSQSLSSSPLPPPPSLLGLLNPGASPQAAATAAGSAAAAAAAPGALAGLLLPQSARGAQQAQSPEVAEFEDVVARVLRHAAEGLLLVSPELDAEGVTLRLNDLAGPLDDARESLRAATAPGAVAGADVATAALAARCSLFSSTARLLTRELMLTSPEGVAGLEHLLQLHIIALGGLERIGSSGGGGGLGSRRGSVSAVSVGLGPDGVGREPDRGGEPERAARRAALPSIFASVSSPASSRRPLCSWLGALLVRWRPEMAAWLPAYKRKYLAADVLSGVTIGILLLPQGLAYAALARQPEFLGLYTGFPAAVYAVFGTSRQGAIGPQSIPALIISSSLIGIPDDEYPAAVASVTLLSGLITLAAGWLRLGDLVRFISRPVLTGFAAGSAILTIASSAKDVIGVNVERHAALYDTLAALGAAIPHTHWPTAVFASSATLLLLVLPRAPWNRVLPAPLLVTVLSIAFMALWMHYVDHIDLFGPSASGSGGGGGGGGGTNSTDYDDDAVVTDYSGPFGIQLIGPFPTSLPAPTLPTLPLARLPLLLTTALTVTLVGFIESITVAKMYALKHGYAVSAESELKALGCANIFGSTLGALPVMAAFGRSSINDASGARTPLAQAVSALTVCVLVVAISPALFYLPKAALAAVIIVAVSGLVGVAQARALWRTDKSDFACLLASFAATAGLGVAYGVIFAVAISLTLFVGALTRSAVVELGRVRGTTTYAPLGEPGVAPLRVAHVLRFPAPLWFANAPTLRDRLLRELALRRELPPRLRMQALVLDFSAVSGVDSTAAQLLGEAVAAAHADAVPLLLAAVPPLAEAALARFGLVEALGGPRFLAASVHDAVRAVAAREVGVADLPAEVLRGGNERREGVQVCGHGRRAAAARAAVVQQLCEEGRHRQPLELGISGNKVFHATETKWIGDYLRYLGNYLCGHQTMSRQEQMYSTRIR